MIDMAPIPTLGGGAIPIRGAAGRGTILVPVEPGGKGRGAEARMDGAPQSPQPPARIEHPDDAAPDAAAPKPIDESTLLGPTPAFQANVLELERDLRQAIERLESERARAEAELAFRIEKAETDVAAADNAATAARDAGQSALIENAAAEVGTTGTASGSETDVNRPPETGGEQPSGAPGAATKETAR